MGKIIYWKEFGGVIKKHDPIMNIERNMSGEFICEDERISRFGFIGYLIPNGTPKMGMKGVFILINGDRAETEINLTLPTDEQSNSADPSKALLNYCISQAEQYLQSLPK